MGSSCTTHSNSDKNNPNHQNNQMNKKTGNLFPKGKFYYNISESK